MMALFEQDQDGSLPLKHTRQTGLKSLSFAFLVLWVYN